MNHPLGVYELVPCPSEHARTHTHTRTHTHVCAYTHDHTQAHTWSHTLTHTQCSRACTHVIAHKHTCVCTHDHTNKHTHTHTRARAHTPRSLHPDAPSLGGAGKAAAGRSLFRFPGVTRPAADAGRGARATGTACGGGHPALPPRGARGLGPAPRAAASRWECFPTTAPPPATSTAPRGAERRVQTVGRPRTGRTPRSTDLAVL